MDPPKIFWMIFLMLISDLFDHWEQPEVGQGGIRVMHVRKGWRRIHLIWIFDLPRYNNYWKRKKNNFVPQIWQFCQFWWCLVRKVLKIGIWGNFLTNFAILFCHFMPFAFCDDPGGQRACNWYGYVDFLAIFNFQKILGGSHDLHLFK